MQTRIVNRLTAGEINLLMLSRGGERYAVIYPDNQRGIPAGIEDYAKRTVPAAARSWRR